MLRVVSNPDKLREYQGKFEKQFMLATPQKINCTINTKEGPTIAHIFWLPNYGIWFYSDIAIQGNRWWNVFGVEKPINLGTIHPQCEVCIPNDGINRRVAGAFAEDGNNVFVLHRGNRYGGGKEGMTSDHFWSNYRYESEYMIDGDQVNRVAVIGELGNKDFLANVASFISWMIKLQEVSE